MNDRDVAHRRVQDGVLADIRAGIYPPGGRLPTETHLAEQYAVRRSVVSWALHPLRWAGLIVGPRGGIARVAGEPRRTKALNLIAEADRIRAEGDDGPEDR